MLSRQRWTLELRHLRYFVAVAEARSLKLAAEEKLHTTQPSLSRQIRDLEHEVGASLFLRSARGVELTAAGRIFLDHARVMLSQAETAVQSVRQVANPTKPYFALGFMIGHDSTWLPEALHILRDELPNIHVVISTQNSPQLAAGRIAAPATNAALLSKSPSMYFCRKIIRSPRRPRSVFSRSSVKHFSAYPGLLSAFREGRPRCDWQLIDSSKRAASTSGRAMRWTIWAV